MIVENDELVLFWQADSIYSNWHPAKFRYASKDFLNSEAAFMYMKAILFEDIDISEKILLDQNPYNAKHLGRTVKNYQEEKWSEVRYPIMVDVCLEKFQQNPIMLKELLATTNKEIVEASPYDLVWGIGIAPDNPKALNRDNWRGQNLLGKALMEVRRRLKD